MNYVSILAIISTFFTLSIKADHPAPDAEGFVVLYDGSNLDSFETEGNWQIQDDGSLYLEPREGEEGWKRYGSYLWTKEKYGDFTFDFEYKHPEGGNSGFHFRISDREDPVNGGFEVQIMDSTGKADGEMGHHDLGGVIKTKGASKNMSKPAGEWNRMTVSMKGDQITVVLNGEPIQKFNLREEKPEDKEMASEGYIAIQDHGVPFWVRNIRVRKD